MASLSLSRIKIKRSELNPSLSTSRQKATGRWKSGCCNTDMRLAAFLCVVAIGAAPVALDANPGTHESQRVNQSRLGCRQGLSVPLISRLVFLSSNPHAICVVPKHQSDLLITPEREREREREGEKGRFLFLPLPLSV